ncbi:MAG: VWA domain-containing protein [Hyphomicrobiales bacterium]
MSDGEELKLEGVEVATLSGATSGKFAENVLHFGRLLRVAGLPIGPTRIVDATNALQITGLENKEDVYSTLHAVFVSKREHHAVFDAAFKVFWSRNTLLGNVSGVVPPEQNITDPLKKQDAASARIANALMQHVLPSGIQLVRESEIAIHQASSRMEALCLKDFAQMDNNELTEAKRVMADLVLPVSDVKTRRFTPATNGDRIDLRKTIRASLASGGEWMVPVYKKRTQIKPPIVALCDISGSMSQYSRLFLHFLHALGERQSRVQSFVFGTQLTNITRALKHKDPDDALDACSALVKDWSGGTRIATSLKLFNRNWSRRVLGQGAIVLLITDGLERDSEADIGFETERLQKSCRQLIWLNPLLRYDGFEARASGVRAMLPYVDQFRAVHSLDAIADLCDSLTGEQNRQLSTPVDWLRKTG